MAIRKEQGLLLVTLAFAYWMFSGLETVKSARLPKAKARKYESVAAHVPMIVDGKGPVAIRELFREPSESRPLPPRDNFAFPKFDPLPVVLLPLPMGQHPAAYYGLRHAPFAAVPKADDKAGGNAGAAKNAAGSAPDVADGNGGAPNVPAAAALQDAPSLRYDRIFLEDGRKFYGLFLGNGKAGTEKVKFSLANRNGAIDQDQEFRFQWIVPESGKRNSILTEKDGKLARLELARTLRNEIGKRLHKFQPTQANVLEQRDFIHYLLDKARLEPWVFETAAEQAKTYAKFAKPKEEGILYQAVVLRAKGDLPAEYKLFRDLDDDKELAGSSFQYRGLGLCEAKLGLDKLAEEHLKKAVAISKPIDPRNYAGLAGFYLDRGRAAEAVEYARQAVKHRNLRDSTDAERVGFDAVLVSALLAVGNLEEAAAKVSAAVPAALQYTVDYQRACVAYARQDFASAEPLFQQVYNTGRTPVALVGLAASQLALGKTDVAKASFEKVVDEQPRWRHLGLAGLAIALSADRGVDALEKIDAAIVTFPNHPYLLYLQGRQRRLNGDLDSAVEPLRKALRLHDDFLEALAELTATYYGVYERSQDLEALVSARRYVDRLVQFDQQSGGRLDLFLEWQGRIRYKALDLAGAKEAFATRGEQASPWCKVGLAMVEYAQKRQDLAADRIANMQRDLGKEGKDKLVREHVDGLLQLMLRHGNKEQVVDRFDRSEPGKAWQGGSRSGQVRAKLVDGEMRFSGRFGRRAGLVTMPRSMEGPGRFLEFRSSMRLGADNRATFAGVHLTIPRRGSGKSQFSLRIGVDDRGRLMVHLVDGRNSGDPIDTGIDVKDQDWHDILVSVDDPDDVDPKKNASRILKVEFDGASLIPAARAKLNTLRRSATKTNRLITEYLVEGGVKSQVDVAFKNYRRVQERKK